MRWTHHFFSAVQFFQVLLLIMGGLFCLALPFAPSLRVKISNLFLLHEKAFLYLGGLLVIIGIILGIGFYFLQRHWIFQISMDPPVAVERQVIADLVKVYLQNRFPDRVFKTEVLISSQGLLEIIAETPSFPMQDVEKHFQEIEHEIGELLKRSLGYQKKFNFTFVA